MAASQGVSKKKLLGNVDLIAKLDLGRFANAKEGLGKFTLDDIRAELESPGRDPRAEFRTPKLREDVQKIEDLKAGMVLEGRVSNVTNFGAFVDIGVKRDGLVHLSELTRRWVEDPRGVVRVGQIVEVKVLEVDRERQRISLSMKALEPEPETGQASRRRPARPRHKKARRGTDKPHKPVPQKKPVEPTTIEELLKKWAPRH
jgi:uncharacterized protein